MHDDRRLEALAEELTRRYNGLYVRHDLSFRDAEQEFERQFFARQLELQLGNIAKTAERIGLAESTLYEKIGELGLSPDRYRPTKEAYQEQPFTRREVIEGIVERAVRAVQIDDVIIRATEQLASIPRLSYREAMDYFTERYFSARECGSVRKTAREVGLPKSTLQDLLMKRVRKSGEYAAKHLNNQYIG